MLGQRTSGDGVMELLGVLKISEVANLTVEVEKTASKWRPQAMDFGMMQIVQGLQAAAMKMVTQLVTTGLQHNLKGISKNWF